VPLVRENGETERDELQTREKDAWSTLIKLARWSKKWPALEKRSKDDVGSGNFGQKKNPKKATSSAFSDVVEKQETLED